MWQKWWGVPVRSFTSKEHTCFMPGILWEQLVPGSMFCFPWSMISMDRAQHSENSVVGATSSCFEMNILKIAGALFSQPRLPWWTPVSLVVCTRDRAIWSFMEANEQSKWEKVTRKSLSIYPSFHLPVGSLSRWLLQHSVGAGFAVWMGFAKKVIDRFERFEGESCPA